ncbi:hypothetical protein [Mycolicibacterium sphagni]|uniref:Transposase n=1 Tax=Mycolicibacterium sphagni TaxID=1786 RepID=A0ABX2K5P6_9MYCO|nr:hypothetical protein [Mycolicibacterium sphagni]NTY62398.1 hypothetical protein [Mycolicibacterium sphagni]
MTSTSAADSGQAQYFRCLLVERRAELEARLAHDAGRLAARRRSGSTSGVKSIRYRIKILERQRSELDRLLDGLDGLVGAVSN